MKLRCSLALLFLVTPYCALAQSFDLNVPSTSAWFDTGVDIQAGQLLNVTAIGTVQWATSSPGINADGIGQGWDGTQKNANTELPDAIWLSLVGKTGGSIDIVTGIPVPEGLAGHGGGFVGTSYSQVIPNGGRLFFGFNDTIPNWGDNSGSFSVHLTVVPEPSSISLLLVAGVIVSARLFGRSKLRSKEHVD